MRITLISPHWSVIATTKRAIKYATLLARIGHKIRLILPEGDPFAEYERQQAYLNNFELLFSPLLGIARMRASSLLKCLSHGLGPIILESDILHFFKPQLNGIMLLLSKYLKNQRVILDLDDPEFLFDKNRTFGGIGQLIAIMLERNLPKHSDGVIVASDELGKFAVKLGVKREKIFYLPIGTDVKKFSNGNGEKIKKRNNVSSPLICYVGRLELEYDIDLLLYAMKHIASQISSIKLIVVGSGPGLSVLTQLTRTLDIEKNVLFVGYRPYKEIPDFLAAADVLVLPMRNTALNRMRFPTKLCEYLASGKPVIASNVVSVNKLIKNRKNGLLSKAGSPKDLARKIIEVLRDSDLASKLGESGKKTAGRYDLAPIIQRLIGIYHKVQRKPVL